MWNMYNHVKPAYFSLKIMLLFTDFLGSTSSLGSGSGSGQRFRILPDPDPDSQHCGSGSSSKSWCGSGSGSRSRSGGGGGRSAKNVHPPWQNPRYAPACLYTVRPTGNYWKKSKSYRHSRGKQYFLCCGSGMFIPDPGSWFLPIPDPGSRIPDKNSNRREGQK